MTKFFYQKRCAIYYSPLRQVQRFWQDWDKFHLGIWLVTLHLFFISGCATVPKSPRYIRAVTIEGAKYVSLNQLCNNFNINFDYDPFASIIDLNIDDHNIRLLVNSKIALVDDIPYPLRSSVILKDNIIYLPAEIQEQIIILQRTVKAEKIYKPAFSLKHIIIDAGHGGKDPGAVGRTGLKEKDVVLDIAKRLKDLLERQGIKTTLTRSSDTFVSLERRSEIANRINADLFLSIHANANRSRGIHGFEIYYLSEEADDTKRAESASALTLPQGIDQKGISSNTKTILWDLIYTQNRVASVDIARSISKEADDTFNPKILGIKRANFYVLKKTVMPAVLVEVGFVSNSREESLLRSGSYRQKISEAIAKGLINYNSNYQSVVSH